MFDTGFNESNCDYLNKTPLTKSVPVLVNTEDNEECKIIPNNVVTEPTFNMYDFFESDKRWK